MSTAISTDDLDRESTDVDGDSIRFYFTDDGSVIFPSVTSITSFRHDPEKEEAIAGWKQYRDGEVGTGYNHVDIRNYKGWRGTLAHYTCLNRFSNEDLWSEEEETAQHEIENFGNYQDEDCKNRCLREINFVANEFEDLVIDLGLDEESIIQVEQFIIDEEYEYAGQFDLLYQDGDETVLADLKTSKLKRDRNGDVHEHSWNRVASYGMQLAAYANATERDVDRCEIIWISPDEKNVEVIDESRWPRTRESYFREFAGLATRLNDEKLSDIGDIIDDD